MLGRNKVIIILIIAVCALVSSVYAQGECGGSLTISSEDYIDRDGTVLVELPLYIANSCPLGGVQFDLTTDPFGALEPVDIILDTSRIAYWERLVVTRDRLKRRVRLFGLADYPDLEDTPPLEAGEGYLGTALYRFGCQYDEDITVDINIDSVFFADSSGYSMFEAISIDNGTVHVGHEITPIGRGDMNCDGFMRGSDVTYMVNYFRGANPNCPCSRCAGDANNDGRIIGSDVTFLVNYFLGNIPSLAPCD